MIEKLIKAWSDALASLDTNGGHIFLLLVLAFVLTASHCQSMEKFQGEVIGALLMACRGGKQS